MAVFAVRTEYRIELEQYLKERGIGTLIHYPIPLHLQQAYNDLEYKLGDFPIAEEISRTVLSLPMWYGMSKEEINYIIGILNQW